MYTKSLAKLCLLFATGLALAQSSAYATGLKETVEGKSFTELLNTKQEVSPSEIALAQSSLWSKYQGEVKADQARTDSFTNKALKFGDKTMRFSMATRGEKPAQGYPLYIALHGGGAAGAGVNDSQWIDMQRYYLDSVSSGIYVATRGVTDTWNLHFVEESYPLYDELIELMVAMGDVDPNRVYILGFSAGGDGVYQIAPRMADRFAAANMSAGHHNWIKFDNLYQTPFLIQVGENDAAYKRNTVAVENHIELNRLQGLHPDGYAHDVYVHAGGSHNSWRDNDASSAPHTILAKPIEWLTSQNHETTARDTNAIHWLDQYARNPYPNHLIWDPKTSAQRVQTSGAKYLARTQAKSLSQPKNLFYWLDVEASDLTAESILIDAWYDKATNSVSLANIDALKSIKILLREEMLDLSQPIHVSVDGQAVADVSVKPDLAVMLRTLLERGDPSFMFQAEIVLNKGERWVSPQASSPANYSYCSKDSCRTVTSQPSFFFGQLPSTVATHCREPGTYAMTFDDGPSDNYPAVLDILARNEVKATFFVLGNHLSEAKNTDFLRAAHLAGHQISNHSFSHGDLMKLDDAAIVKELEDTKAAIIRVLGNDAGVVQNASIVRPPFGYLTAREENLLLANDYTSVRWNSDRSDWELGEDGRALELQRLNTHLAFAKNQSIADYNDSIIDLNHDFSVATLGNLETMIQSIKAQNYRFVTVSQCLGLTP